MRRRLSSRGFASSAFLIIIGVVAMSGCGSSSGHAAPSVTASTTTSLQSSRANPSHDSLRTAARAYANAYLTGAIDDIVNLEGPECLTGVKPTPALERRAGAALRAKLQRYLGVVPSSVKIRGVRTRNVTATSGEAEVEYDLPVSAVGNYNWVTYELHSGKWKVADCNAPIGGSGSSSSVATTTRPK